MIKHAKEQLGNISFEDKVERKTKAQYKDTLAILHSIKLAIG